MSYPYVQKIADSCDMPMSELLQVSSDVPPPPKQGETFSDMTAGDAAQPPPASAAKDFRRHSVWHHHLIVLLSKHVRTIWISAGHSSHKVMRTS
ncbi:hypothetical protein Tco_0498941 [Tanacetum coccineum]